MAVDSTGMDKAKMPAYKKSKKKKKNKGYEPASEQAKTYEQITDESFLRNEADWQEASDDYSFDDIQAAVSKAMHAEYDTEYKSSIGYSGGDYAGNGKVCRYYIYKVWPDKAVFKRAYGNNNEEDPLFVMHSYEMSDDGKAVLGEPIAVDMGFVPSGTGMTSFMTAVREVDEVSIDDPQLASHLTEDETEDEPDEEEDEYDADDSDPDDDDDPDDDEAEEDSEEENVQETALREDIGNLAEQPLREEFENAIDGSCRITEQKDSKGGIKAYIIENMAVIGPKSKNKREYPTDTRKRALKLFEGAKAYANHPRKGEEDQARGISEAIGRHRNVYYDPATDMVRSNLHLSPTALVRDYIIPHAKANPSLIGNSINGGGKLSESGKVLEITKLASIDLVTDPATTSGLYEQVEKDQPKQKGETHMATTKKEILEDKALTEELREHFREELEVELSVSGLQEQNEALQEERDTLREEIQEYKLKDKARETRAEIQTMLNESKLSAESKEDEELFQILEEAKPERRAALIKRFEKAATEANGSNSKHKGGSAPSTAREKDLQETRQQVSRDDLARSLHRGLTGGRRYAS